jgi:hypothetical protein
VHLRHRLGDRQPQATAGGRRVGQAVEAVEHARALGLRNARAAVLHHQHPPARGLADQHADLDAAAGRRILDGVFNQIAQQQAQRVGMARHQGRFQAREPDLLRTDLGVGHRLADHRARQRHQVQRRRRGALGQARLLARQFHQLAHQPRGAVDAGVQPLQRALAGLGVAGAAQPLHLQPERRQRRAQLVRRVGHEALLHLEGLAQALQQTVEFLHQRANLVGQVLPGQRRQVVGAARGHLLPHPFHRRQRAAHQPAHGEHQGRRQPQHRRGRAQRQVAGHALAHRHVLRHLDHQAAGDHRIDAVGGAVGHHVGKAQHRARRQLGPVGRAQQQRAVDRPDLQHEVEVLLRGRHRQHAGGQALGQAGAQGLGGLAHLVVEQGVGLGPRRAPGQGGLQQRGGQDGQQHKHQQAGAQGGRPAQRHALGTR